MSKPKDDYVDKLKAQLDEWNAEIDRIQAKAKQASDENEARLEAQLADMRSRRDEAERRMKELQLASDQAWDHMREGFQNAWSEIAKSFDRARSSFR